MKKIIFFIGLFVVGTVFGQETKNVKVDLRTPQSAVRTHLHFLNPDSYHPEKAAKTIHGYTGERAEELAVKLEKILEGRGLFVVFRKLPSDPNFGDTVQDEFVHRYVLFPERMPKVYLEKIDGSWYYSKQTLLLVDKLYDEVFPWYAQKIHEFLPKFGNKSFFGIPIWKYSGLVLLLVISVLLFFIFNKLIYFILAQTQKNTSKLSSSEVAQIFKKIARLASLLAIIALIRGVIPILNLGIKFNTVLFFCVDLLFILFVVFIFFKVVDFLMIFYTKYTEKTNSKLDTQLTPIVRHILKIIVGFLGLLKVLAFLGINPVTIMAGLSIGGLAFALASQDTVKNFIGTIMIFVDKPFRIGDFIIAGDVEGTVEKVGFRSTLVRAPDTSIYQITNSRLSEITVKNRGLLRYRRYRTELGIRYDTPPELVETFVEGVRQIIAKHPRTLKENYNVEFTGFGNSSLLILMNVYFLDTNWGKEQAARHSLHIAILKFANAIGVGFAFPSTTVMVEQFPKTGNDFPKYSADRGDVDEILKGITLE